MAAIVTPSASAGALARPAHASEFGPTLPPIGFVKFCQAQPAACDTAKDRKPSALLAASSERWQLLNDINSYVNHKIAPISDKDLYGEAELWTYPVDAGDCEDYALLKQRLLTRLGIPASDLLITVVLDEKKEGHAVLTVTTSEGDFILDNRTNEIRRWDETSYDYLKRQSRQDGRKWVALVKSKVRGQAVTTSRK